MLAIVNSRHDRQMSAESAGNGEGRSWRPLLLILVLLISILLFEVVARLALPLDARRTIYAKTRDVFTFHDEHICYDSELGFVLRPGIDYELRNLEYRIRISTNSLGFRDDEESLKQPAILSIGDSFAFGSGVSEGSTVSDCLESELGCRALNAGVPQYGTLQEIRLFKRLVETGVAPDCLTFVFFYGGNDLITTVNRTHSEDWFRPYVESRDGVREIVGPTQEGFAEWRTQVSRARFPALCRYSYTAYTLVEAWRRLTRGRDHEPSMRQVGSAEMLDGVGFIVSEFARTCPVHTSKVVFVYVPTRKYFEDPSYRERTDQAVSYTHLRAHET